MSLLKEHQFFGTEYKPPCEVPRLRSRKSQSWSSNKVLRPPFPQACSIILAPGDNIITYEIRDHFAADASICCFVWDSIGIRGFLSRLHGIEFKRRSLLLKFGHFASSVLDFSCMLHLARHKHSVQWRCGCYFFASDSRALRDVTATATQTCTGFMWLLLKSQHEKARTQAIHVKLR